MWYYFFSGVHSKRAPPLRVSIIRPSLSITTGATYWTSLPDYLFGGRAVAGLAVGALTHVVPMYLAEISSANVRGSLVALQQLSITIGVILIIIPHTCA